MVLCTIGSAGRVERNKVSPEYLCAPVVVRISKGHSLKFGMLVVLFKNQFKRAQIPLKVDMVTGKYLP